MEIATLFALILHNGIVGEAALAPLLPPGILFMGLYDPNASFTATGLVSIGKVLAAYLELSLIVLAAPFCAASADDENAPP
ncbi:MAG: hypothetical protein PSV24_15475 [Rhodoferax sp.]|nr:hypothetical protein [Rhodoferax sp.]